MKNLTSLAVPTVTGVVKPTGTSDQSLLGVEKVSTTSLAVVMIRGEWTLLARGVRWGRFNHRVDAEEAALRVAASGRQSGETIEVLVQGRYGELERLTPDLAGAAA
jgi:hypothetical protein